MEVMFACNRKSQSSDSFGQQLFKPPLPVSLAVLPQRPRSEFVVSEIIAAHIYFCHKPCGEIQLTACLWGQAGNTLFRDAAKR